MPMPGVYKALHQTAIPLRTFATAQRRIILHGNATVHYALRSRRVVSLPP